MKRIRSLNIILIVCIMLLTPLQKAAAKSNGQTALPFSARMIIAKVSPMMQTQKYAQAIETLLAFQARGGQ